jgi:hypothetical protein
LSARAKPASRACSKHDARGRVSEAHRRDSTNEQPGGFFGAWPSRGAICWSGATTPLRRRARVRRARALPRALGFGLGQVVPHRRLELRGIPGARPIVSTVMYTPPSRAASAAASHHAGHLPRRCWQRRSRSGSSSRGEVLWGGIKSTFGASAVLTVIALFGLVPRGCSALHSPSPRG